MDARPVRAKDLNTTPPRDALASQAKARAWLESLQERMQPAYAAEDKARERYKNASSDQRDRYDLEKKWNIASAKVAQLEKEWDQAHAAVKRAIPGFEW
jgi:multidrug resistance efflux pump